MLFQVWKNIFNRIIIECKNITYRYAPQSLYWSNKLSRLVNVNSGVLTHHACHIENCFDSYN